MSGVFDLCDVLKLVIDTHFAITMVVSLFSVGLFYAFG